MNIETTYAVFDLGSNSFRVEISRMDFGQFTTVEYLKEAIRLGAGLNEEGNLTSEAMQTGLDCLARFAEKIKSISPACIRVVATQALREAHNRDEFVKRASQILGVPLEVISGQEEARLIYLGVSHLLPQTDQTRLVVDIGGRSTEVIRGHGMVPDLRFSFPLGSVSFSQKYFAHEVTDKQFKRAVIAAEAIFETMLDDFMCQPWDVALGASGSVGAVARIMRENSQAIAGDTQDHEGVITLAGLQWLRAQCVAAGSADALAILGLKEERKPVLAGGVAILLALFESFQISELIPAEGSLRTRVLYELAGKDQPTQDIRQQSMVAISQRFDCDAAQSQRVANIAHHVFESCMEIVDSASTQLLGWAVMVHEVGRIISYTDFNHHGHYLLSNIDAAGLSATTQLQLALLVLGQRGSLKKVQSLLEDEIASMQLFALRFAVVMCHARRQPERSTYAIMRKKQRLIIKIESSWAQQHPQTMFLLEEEQNYWRRHPTLELELHELV